MTDAKSAAQGADVTGTSVVRPRGVTAGGGSRPVPVAGVGRRTVSISQDVLSEVDSRVGARGFSSYVAEAVRRQLQHDKLGEFLDQAERSGGPISEAERSAARKAVAAAMSPKAR